MRFRSFAAVTAAVLVQVSPLIRQVAVVPFAGGVSAWVLPWLGWIAAVAGSFHSVSGATATLVSPDTASGEVGKDFVYRITISDGKTRTPEKYDLVEDTALPPGLNLPAGGTVFIRGKPTEAGTYRARIRAWRYATRTQDRFTFTLTFTIAPGAVAPAPSITSPLRFVERHAGEGVQVSVTAAGAGVLTYGWQKDGVPLAGETSSQWEIPALTEAHSGMYAARVTHAGGLIVTNQMDLKVIPLLLSFSPTHQPGFRSIAGRSYSVFTASSLGVWQPFTNVLGAGGFQPIPWPLEADALFLRVQAAVP